MSCRITSMILSIAFLFVVCVFLVPTSNAQTGILKNHTPKHFPWSANDVPRSWETLDPDETPQSIMQICRNGSQKFILEVRPAPFWEFQSATAIVDGVNFQMTEVGTPDRRGRLFFYEANPPKCGPKQYQYAFAVKYKDLSAKGITKTQVLRPSPNTWFKVDVLGADHFVWWYGYGSLPTNITTDSQKDILLRAREDGTGERLLIYIQRLSKMPMRVSFIGIDSQGDSTFKLVNLPVSREMQCQEVIKFDLVWTPNPPDFEDHTKILFIVSYYFDGRWVEAQPVVINVLTGPYQGPG